MSTASSSRSSSWAWTPSTVHQLSHGPLHFDILDDFFDQGEEARSEVLTSEPLLSSLQPARTTGDAQLQAILNLANANNGEHAVAPTSRGDKSTFLPHEVRTSEYFAKTHPHFVQLLETLEVTVRRNVSSAFQLEGKVSVQLAVYPGDGTSGYPKHCDVSRACGIEGGAQNQQASSRILTAIYYLTPSDWAPTKDQGYLRLFHSATNHHDAAPIFNRCIIFRSDKVPHQVLPSRRRDRVAVTMWFYGTPLQQQQQQSVMPAAARVQSLNQQLAAFPQNMSPPLPVQSLNQQPAAFPQNMPLPVQSLNQQPAAFPQNMPPPLPVSPREEPDSTSTIFVSIASFRDSETYPTIQHLFSTAQFPDRVVVGLVYQFDPQEDATLNFDKGVRVMTLHARDARGPCYARRLAQLLYRGEDYILQIDSHMRFRQRWDTYLIQQLDSCGDDDDTKTLLTTYPVGYTLPNNIPNEIRPTLMVPWKFDNLGMLRQRGRLLTSIPDRPVPTQLYAAGFCFGRGASNADCPYPTFENVFFGEEVYRAIQFHNKGYRLYAPTETVVYHLWSRAHRPVHSCTAAETTTNDDDTNNADAAALWDFLNHEVSSHVWKLMGVANWAQKRLEPGANLGGMGSEDAFVESSSDQNNGLSTLQLRALDPETQAAIVAFLSQIG